MGQEAPAQPRWGNQARDRKSEGIRLTLESRFGEQLRTRQWLDVGCGSGGIAKTLASHVESVVGVDPEPWPVWAELEASQGNLRFLATACDGPSPPLPANFAGVIVCNQVYEHVSDPVALIRNLYQMLEPGGVCYFAGPNLLWPIEPHVFWPFVHWLPRPLAQAIMRACSSRKAAELDAYSSSYWTLARWFADAGFTHEVAIKARLVAGLRLSKWPALATACLLIPEGLFRLLSPLAPGHVFIIRKPR